MCSRVKRIILIFLCLCFVFTGCTYIADEPVDIPNKYVKSVWITYYELEGFIKDKNENQYKNYIKKLIIELKDIGFNTITVQVRPCADALYKSNVFPSSKYAFGIQGSQMPYDPFGIICEIAENNNIDVEAWINPYRVSQDDDFAKLSKNNVANKWKDSRNIFVVNKKIFFNPASSEVTKLIVSGVKEICENYQIKAIHFDDYFYPTKDKSIDSVEYEGYINNGGNLSLDDWRRENITSMLKAVNKQIKSTNKDIKLGVSPSANINEDYNKLYADVENWSSSNNVVDYICPQIYYGFKNESLPFMFTTKKWLEISNVDTYVGLPMYKIGKNDDYAGESGKNEFINDGIISRQIEYLLKLDRVKGIYIFSYSSIKGHEDELTKLKEI